MPASFRKKPKLIRQVSEDIEEDGPTQDHPMDDVDSDEEPAPRPSGKKGKAVANGSSQRKKSATAKKEKRGSGDEAESSDDDEVIDVHNFKDHPIQKSQANTLNGLAADWNTCDVMIRQNWSVLQKIGEGLADVADENEEPEEIDELDDIMRELIDLSAKFNSSKATLDELYQKISREEDVAGVKERYTEGYEARDAAYSKKTMRQKYAKVPEYMDFKSAIWNALHPEKPMPPLTDLFEKEAGDKSDSDDDLEIGGQTKDYKCPITLSLLKDPLTAQGCKHSYSAEAIRASFQGKGTGANIPCPAAGCRARITLAMCRPDPQLAKRVKAYERKLARQEEQEPSDVEEVID